MLVVNASNRSKILDWISSHRSADDQVQVRDRTSEWGMVAVQGPRSLDIVQPLVDTELRGIRYYWFAGTATCGSWAIVSRTGYTGEDGVELILPVENLEDLWARLLDQGAPLGLCPVGLGARDTLRLEAGMPLYGHELNETINPLEAGLSYAVKFDKPQFVGKEALLEAQRVGVRQCRIGLELEGKRIAREGMSLTRQGQGVGHVSSGTFGPTVQKSIAMGFVPPELSAPGQLLSVDIRGQAVPARVVKLPFYKRPRTQAPKG
jgi:aminomethyltransferase